MVQRSRPQVAFLAAALALLVLPLAVMFGLTALGVLLSPSDNLMDRELGGMWLAVFVIWVLVVIAAVLALIARLVRRTSRS
jgi:threonine/homoserine/homoserine lactone efflux protein